MSTDAVLSGAAWRAFCDRLAALGERILADDFPGEAQRPCRGHAPPRDASGLLAHLRDRLQ